VYIYACVRERERECVGGVHDLRIALLMGPVSLDMCMYVCVCVCVFGCMCVCVCVVGI